MMTRQSSNVLEPFRVPPTISAAGPIAAIHWSASLGAFCGWVTQSPTSNAYPRRNFGLASWSQNPRTERNLFSRETTRSTPLCVACVFEHLHRSSSGQRRTTSAKYQHTSVPSRPHGITSIPTTPPKTCLEAHTPPSRGAHKSTHGRNRTLNIPQKRRLRWRRRLRRLLHPPQGNACLL